MILEHDTFKKYGYYSKDISNYSHKKVIVKCDYCNNIYEKSKYNMNRSSNIIDKICCIRCCTIKREESMKAQYGGRGFSPSMLKAIEERKKHGDSKSRLYHTWIAMKHRCNNLDDKNYGGKGIKICSEWVNDFIVFKKWSILNGYRNDLSIDRIDSDKNYCPENCRWITPSENAVRVIPCINLKIKEQESYITYLQGLLIENKIDFKLLKIDFKKFKNYYFSV